ncbi:ATP-binding protein [Frankia sp. Mgl5]|uniref:ATP-binding protein n=1 Tax=Frankia sp. Mgl5 TaxID=2933793 RepID=UPI00200F4EF6|nr:ATP-binding protein [Frankia sp. Mgl5]MCK9929204.1 ATP-binding protein [Frankia sp. Mgl5]
MDRPVQSGRAPLPEQAGSAESRAAPELRPAPVDGEPTPLERMTANLVDNAVRYNHRGGHVTVETGVAEDVGAGDADVLLQITNSGPLIPAGGAAGPMAPRQP